MREDDANRQQGRRRAIRSPSLALAARTSEDTCVSGEPFSADSDVDDRAAADVAGMRRAGTAPAGPFAPRPEQTMCFNCGAALQGRFCADCGQEAKPLNPRLRDIVRDLIEELSDVDGRIFRSVYRLFLSPGFLTREQFLGRRVSWLAPLRLYLLFSVLYFATASFTNMEGMRVSVTTRPGVGVATQADAAGGSAAKTEEQEDDAVFERAGYGSEQAFRAAVGEAWITWLPRVMFVLVPVFAGLVTWVRRRSRLSYPLHVYFALHLHATWFGLSALAAAGYLVHRTAGDALGSLRTVAIMVYLYLALRTAYGLSRRRALLDTTILITTYFLVILAAMAAIFLPLLWPLINS